MRKQAELLHELLSPEEKAELEGKPQKKTVRPFISLASVRKLTRRAQDVIKSGNKVLDRSIGGFNKGELSIISGTNASGKSSWLSQLALEAAAQGYYTALYSGELTPQRVLRWLMLPAAGKKYTQERTFENTFYEVKPEVEKVIQKWLAERIFLYNNQYSVDVKQLLDAMGAMVHQKRLSLIIIDNLMSLDIRSLHKDKYEAQAMLVQMLAERAKEWNVHIFFVCHPRKSMGFLRKEDIAGTADITNAADNVFIMHRVNTDFKNRIAEVYSESMRSSLEQYSNVLEICKNRDFGVQDTMCGMYYERESARFLDKPNQEKVFGWEYYHVEGA